MTDDSFEGWVTIHRASQLIERDHKLVKYWADKGFISERRIPPRLRLVNLEEVRAYAEKHPSRIERNEAKDSKENA